MNLADRKSLRASSLVQAHCVVLVAVLCGSFAPSVFSSEATASEREGRSPPCTLDFPDDPRDYRLRESTPEMQWHYNDNWNSHTGRLVTYLKAGDYTRNARAEIEWTLYRWPNHLIALQGAIEYDVHRGRPYEFRPIECYWVRARAFAPDDVSVLLAQGVWYWKKGYKDRALNAYEDALKVQPDSADVHYNLGLLLTEMAKYDQALQHAWAAYATGYPLPGLRNKLTKSGHWKDPPKNVAPAAETP